VLRIGKNDAVDQFSISDVPLPVVTSCCDMGITVSHSTSFNEHIKYIVGKGHQRANMIHRCSVSRNEGLYIFYFALLQCMFVLCWSTIVPFGHPVLSKILLQ